MSLLSFDDATLIDVRLVPSEGPHPIWSDDTVSWLLPMLGPSACLLLPRLYGIAATETPQPVDALSFSIGIGRGQLARGCGQLRLRLRARAPALVQLLLEGLGLRRQLPLLLRQLRG